MENNTQNQFQIGQNNNYKYSPNMIFAALNSHLVSDDEGKEDEVLNFCLNFDKIMGKKTFWERELVCNYLQKNESSFNMGFVQLIGGIKVFLETDK